MRFFLFFLFIIFFQSQLSAQELKKQTLLFYISDTDSTNFSIDKFKFYISRICLLKDGEIIFQEENSFHLIDVINGKDQFTFDINKELKYDQVQFLLGIDSLTNVSGALDGDLDPTKGMYWTWQSGYINFKLEGTHVDCPTRDKKFQFHLGGYLPPFLAAKNVLLDCNTQELILIAFDLNTFLKEIDLTTTHTIMSPGQKAVELSSICSKHFKIIE